MSGNETGHHQAICPYESANRLSRLLFWWMIPFYKTGYRRRLRADDIPNISSDQDCTKLADEIIGCWEEEISAGRSKKSSLVKVLLQMNACRLIYPCVLQIIADSQKYLQPFLVERMLSYFDEQSAMSYQEVMLYAGGLTVSSLIYVVANANSFFIGQRIVMMAKSAVSCLIYRKVLKLKSKTFHQTSSGLIVNLLSTDVEKLNAMYGMYMVILQPVETVLLLYFLSRNFGLATLMGVGVFGVIMIIKLSLGNWFGKLRSVIARCTDKRINQTKELLMGIKLVKMFCWESPLGQRIEQLRRTEMKFVGRALRLRTTNFTFDSFWARLVLITLYLGHWALGSPLSEGMFFVSLGWLGLNTFMWMVTIYFIEEAIQCVASLRRIQHFLDLDEENISTKPQSAIPTNLSDIEPRGIQNEDVALSLSSVATTWSARNTASSDQSKEEISFRIKGVSFSVKRGELVAIVGSVGAGKSSLLLSILGDLPLDEGVVHINGSIGLVTQEPWIFSGTIRDNILLGEPFHPQRYNEVLKATALIHDIEGMPHKDGSLVGERGLMLSGGQKARLSLARVIYRQFDIYLLDDPLSAVDTEVGKHLFNQCICGYLGGSTRILVTHQLQYLKFVDKIILMKQGGVTDIGTFGDLNDKGLELTQYGSRTIEENGDKDINKWTENQTSVTDMDEEKQLGTSSWRVYKEYIMAGKGWILGPLFLTFSIGSQVLLVLTDIYLSEWIQTTLALQSHNVSKDASSTSPFQTCVNTSGITAIERGIVSTRVNQSMCHNSSTILHPTTDESQFLFLIFTAGSFVAALVGGHIMASFFLHSSQCLHDQMLPVVLASKMRFFDSNPLGSILNRFSRDIGFIDGALPGIISMCFRAFTAFIVMLAVVCFINPWMLLAMLPFIGSLIVLRRLLLPTMKETKRIEAAGRSPIFSLLSDTLIGRQTIRAMSVADQFVEKFDARQNRHSASWSLYVSAQRGFGLYCSFTVSLYMISIIYMSIHIGNAIPGVLVGLALIYLITLSEIFEGMMRLLLEIETMMTSVERVMAYSKNEPEGERFSLHPPPTEWPKTGNISFKDVCLQYHDTGPPVLTNVSFKINSREKVGIVGRTGAGKSSILTCLFRLAEPSGRILIDGIDISTIGMHELRQKISVITQDPILFEGNLRRNLDLFGEYSDAELYQALAEVQLKDVVERLPGQLDTHISEAGSNFSVGQRQLLCLARTMLRRNRILVLDEATANVDHETDEIIQETIKRRFSDCTVITIAHRLNTIMDSDKVMVLDDGQLVEFDSPYLLLNSPDGNFTRLVEQTGSGNAAKLREVAVSAFQMRSHADKTEPIGLENCAETMGYTQKNETVKMKGFDDEDSEYITHL